MADELPDHYLTLGLESDASAKDINVAYKKLALKYHPDKTGNDKFSIDEFHKIQAAADVLRDPAKRLDYNDTLSIQRQDSRRGRRRYGKNRTNQQYSYSSEKWSESEPKRPQPWDEPSYKSNQKGEWNTSKPNKPQPWDEHNEKASEWENSTPSQSQPWDEAPSEYKPSPWEEAFTSGKESLQEESSDEVEPADGTDSEGGSSSEEESSSQVDTSFSWGKEEKEKHVKRQTSTPATSNQAEDSSTYLRDKARAEGMYCWEHSMKACWMHPLEIPDETESSDQHEPNDKEHARARRKYRWPKPPKDPHNNSVDNSHQYDCSTQDLNQAAERNGNDSREKSTSTLTENQYDGRRSYRFPKVPREVKLCSDPNDIYCATQLWTTEECKVHGKYICKESTGADDEGRMGDACSEVYSYQIGDNDVW